MLRTKGDVQVVEACAPDETLLSKIVSVLPDVLLLEGEPLTRSDLAFVRDLLSRLPGLKVILIGMAEQERTFLEAVRAGVVGHSCRTPRPWTSSPRCARRAKAKRFARCGSCLALFRNFARETGRTPTVRMRMDLGLTRREQQLLPLIAQGMTNKEIATQLNLSEQTIKNHIHRMLQRLGASHRLEAVELVRVQGVYID